MRSETVAVGCHRLPLGVFEPFFALSHLRPTDFISALTERYPHDEARAVVRDWLSPAGGQIACPAEVRQECFLHVASWRALLERSGFRTAPVEERWLAYAESGDCASVEDGETSIATSRYGGWPPIALLHAVPV